MIENNHSSSGPSGATKKTALVVCAVIPPLCFSLLAQALGWSASWVAVGLILGAPNIFAMKNDHYLRWSLSANIIAIALMIFIASGDLWSTLLNDQRTDFSLHLLALLLGVVMAACHQLLLLQSKPHSADMNMNRMVAEALQGPPAIISLCIAFVMCNAVLILLQSLAAFPILAVKFLDRGVIPPITLTLFCWGLLLVAGKWLIVTREFARHDRSQSSFDTAYARAGRSVKKKETLFAIVWQQFEAFYILPRYINWAIPILGFVGTVLGISLATESLSAILADSGSDFSQTLSAALEPLGIAFDTTLIALSLSVILGLLQTLLYRWEERRLLQMEETLS